MSNSLRNLTALALSWVALMLVLSMPAIAQNRIIKGKVVNDKQEPIAGVTVLIQGTDVKREYNVKTDKKGLYFYMGIPAGVYRVVARAPGYEPDFVDNIRPTIQTESEINLQLKPGADHKLAFELSKEELEKLKQEAGKAEKQKQSLAEVKQSFDAGLALSQQGKYDEAIVEFKRALEKDPDQAYVHGNLAEALGKTNKLDEALTEYQKAIAIKPDDAAMYTNMGVLLGKMNKPQESQEAFKKAASLNPGSAAQNFYNLGATLVNSGKVPEGAEAFKQALIADPNFSEAYYQLGICLSGSPATMPDAIKALQKYIEVGQKADQVEVAKQLISALQPQQGEKVIKTDDKKKKKP
jgi:tetratricopeptide (TPR) repeat protein